MPGRLNAAVVGLGVGEQHAHAYLREPRALLRYVVDNDTVKAEQFSAQYGQGIIKPANYNAVLEDADISLISIASYDEDHYTQVMSGLAAGKNLFIEKPLCQTEAQLQDIYAQWHKHPRALASNLVLRAADLYLWLKEHIAQGNMGDIYAFDGDYLYGRLHKITAGWRAETENYSVMEGGGIHILDLMLNLTGKKPRNVISQANKIASRDTVFRYHDFHTAIFEFADGMIGRVTANFGCVHRHHHVIRIFGTKQTFIYDDMGPRLHKNAAADERAEMLPYNPLPATKGALIPGFIDMIEKADFVSSAQQEFDLMSVVLAADKSLQTQKKETIGYISC